MPLLIHVENLSKQYRLGRSTVIDAVAGVTFRTGAGVTGVAGPNGAGKSTLFGLLLGFLRPTTGVVRVGGSPPTRYLKAHGAAYLPERFRLPGGWRVRPALEALARLEDLGGRAASSAADAALERFDLGRHADRPVSALSRGLLQRLGLAQALLAPRALVVLDEPTEGLDPLWRIRLREIVVELGRQGRTVLLASHDLAEMERLADRVILLDAGALREVITVEARPAERLGYRLVVAPGDVAVADFFDGAHGGPDGAYTVTVTDSVELSRRLEAFLVAGGELRELRPTREPLEERVRRSLASDDT